MCTVTGEAYETFKDAEEGRIYDFMIPGTCVKKNVHGLKHGITGPYEIIVKLPIRYRLAKEGWVIPIDYEGISFNDVGQKESDSIVDIIARVVAVKPCDAASTLYKRIVQLQSGPLHENLEVLGDKSKIKLRVNDILAVKGCKITEYNHVRGFATTFLTFMEINPSDNSTVTEVEKIVEGSPTTKGVHKPSDARCVCWRSMRHVQSAR